MILIFGIIKVQICTKVSDTKMGDKIARAITAGMATWRFIFFILASCVTEIYGNAVGWFHFDTTMLALNTILSLWAAVQGSIIMINQNQADAVRDEMLKTIAAGNERIYLLEQLLSEHIEAQEQKTAIIYDFITRKEA